MVVGVARALPAALAERPGGALRNGGHWAGSVMRRVGSWSDEVLMGVECPMCLGGGAINTIELATTMVPHSVEKAGKRWWKWSHALSSGQRTLKEQAAHLYNAVVARFFWVVGVWQASS